MSHKIYDFFRAAYHWSEPLFFISIAALVVLPFTSLQIRWELWFYGLQLLIATLAVAGLSRFICTTMRENYWRKRMQDTPLDMTKIMFLEDEDRRDLSRIAADEAARAAAAEQQRVETSWWVNHNRGF